MTKTRKEMIVAIANICYESETCNQCPGMSFCSGRSEDANEIGVTSFALQTDEELREMYENMTLKGRTTL